MEIARKSGADLVEIRADYLRNREELLTLIEAKPLPVLVTLRSVEEGGQFEGTEEELFSLLELAASAGADWVDVEWRRYRPFARGQSRVILSW
ncbi:MAG: type I 3-dehydroquinate dehydratase, partial [Planctomycetota bacterium]|nr:type I 3-dehydroquinate dehydratase [Planctomycetota bacterium]